MYIKLRKSCYCLLILAGTLCGILGCQGDQQAGKSSEEAPAAIVYSNGEVNIYTDQYGAAEQLIFDNYSRAEKVKVNVSHEPSETLVARVQSEGENSPADIILLGDIAYLFQMKSDQLSRILISNKMDGMKSGLMDPEGYWFAYSMRAMGVAYAKNRVDTSSFDHFADLVGFDGKIARPDPQSVEMRSFVGNIIARQGADDTRKWLGAIAPKMVSAPDFMKSITNGTVDLAFISSSDYLMAIQTQPELAEKIGFLFLENSKDYHPVNVSGIIFSRYSKNIKNAFRFIEFLTDQPTQAVLSEENGIYPVLVDVEPAPRVQALGTLKRDPLDLESLGLQQSQAVKLLNELANDSL